MAFIRTVRVNGNCTKQEGYNGYNSDGVYGFIGTSPAYPCDNNPWSRNSGGLIKIKGNQLKAAKSVRYAPGCGPNGCTPQNQTMRQVALFVALFFVSVLIIKS
jgi:hypothetical protein